MKNIIKHIVLAVIVLSFSWILEVNAWTTTQDFPSVKLRHWYTYNFYDVVNAQSKYIYVSDYNWSTFSERNGDYNGWSNPLFGFTDSFLARNKQVNPYTSEKAFESKSWYSINYHPLVRKSDNLFIKYQMQYYTWEWTQRSAVKTHVENQPYEITWCGDGIRDNYVDQYSWNTISETCDPADPNRVGWGTGGCSNACQPVIAQPVCNSLSYITTQNPITIGVDNTTKTVSCDASNASSIRIDCGNWIIQNFTGDNSLNQIVSASCNYTTAWTYTPTCYVDDTITNFSCQGSLTVLDNGPVIEIIKSDFNPNDKDWVMELNDSQTVLLWEKAVFKITVNNIGWEDLKDVVITDIIEPNCSRTAAETLALYTGSVFAVWDSFTYTCEKLNTQASYTNTADVTGIGVTSNTTVNDTDPTEVIVANVWDFDLALVKTVDTVAPYNIGDIVTYNIAVVNQWNTAWTNIEITDYIPANMELVDWVVDWWSIMWTDRKVVNIIPSVPANATHDATVNIKIKLRILAWATWTIINYSEISSDSGLDCDSTPDNIIDNNSTFNPVWETTGLIDDNIWSACNSGWDEDDHDPAYISISTWGGWWWGGGSGSSPACYNIDSTSTNQFTCTVNRTTFTSWTVWIDCDRDWVYEQVATEWNGLERDSNGRYVATFICSSTDSDWNPITVNPICAVQRWTVLANQSDWYYTVNQCKYIADNICWDWVVQNPNSQWINEQCDGWINCNSDCTLKTTKTTSNCSNSIDYYNKHLSECSTTTRPSGWEIWIYPIWNTLIGWNSVFEFDGSKNKVTNNGADYSYVKIVNIWDEPFNLSEDKFCLYDKFDIVDNNSELIKINGSTTSKQLCEENVIGWLFPGETYYFRKDASPIIWNPDGISVDKDHETTTLVATLAGYDWAYFAAKMNVTVAKPSIANQGGWTTYVADSKEISNINEIAKTVEENNSELGRNVNTNQSNFVATVLGSGSNLSEVDTITDSILIEEAKKESTDLEEEVISIVEESTNTRNSWDINSFDSYNWIDNVYFVKDTNITIPATSFSERKTYIIENGDLIIEWNIESTKNIAFIVKNGDIIIKDNVTKIDWTYVNIWWKIKSENTSNELTVNGSLYGDLSELTSNRTHISMDDEGNINVWTIISFGSNVLNKPAPLVGQFIGEYMDSKKVAQ